MSNKLIKPRTAAASTSTDLDQATPSKLIKPRRKPSTSSAKGVDKAKMAAKDPKNKAGPSNQASANDFVLVDVLQRRVLDWDHRPLSGAGAPAFKSFQQIYSKLVTGLKAKAGGCQAVLLDTMGNMVFARNTSGRSDSATAGQHSEETIFTQENVNSFLVQGIIITIEPCYKDAKGQRYPGHECQAFFRGGRNLPARSGPLRSFKPASAYTPIFFLELQPSRDQTSTTSRLLGGLPPSQAIEWLTGAAGPAFGTVLRPLGKGAKQGVEVIGQEYMEPADIYSKLTRNPYDRIKGFTDWNPTTCDPAVQAAVKQMFSSGAAPAAGSQVSGNAMLANTAVAVVGGAFANAYGVRR
jgi:hypothetical protein